MKTKLFKILTALSLLWIPGVNFGQAPNLGSAASFELFTSVGAITNTGISQVTGNVGSNSGLSTGFGNVNGVMHDNDGASALCATDLTTAYNQLNATVPTFFPAPLLGNGQILNAGVYSIAAPATLNLGLTLDGQGNPNAVFIFKIQGSFSTNALSKVYLVNGALACNVFWKVEGLVSMAAGTRMRGTIIANNAAINMSTGDTLEGRALSTSGAISINGVLAYTPIGCGSPFLTGPPAPTLASIACYAIFTAIGPVNNTGVTNVIGDIGSNNGLTTGYNPLLVVGTIHGVPDGSTAACSTDLIAVYNYLNGLAFDIELLYPVQFGRNLVLTPHIYRMNAAATFTDTLILNGQGNPNAVFVIQINGALTTSTYSRVTLINGTQAKNVFWKVEGAVTINNYSVFRGSIICNNGALNLNFGDTVFGRALSTSGAVNTAACSVQITPGCGPSTPPLITAQPVNQSVCNGSSASFSVTATGPGLTYQWRKGIVNLVNSGNISGATSATLTINPATALDASTVYNVVVTGTFPPSATSTNATLTVNPIPVANASSNSPVCSGNPINLMAQTVLGGTYSWTGPNVYSSTAQNPIILSATLLNAGTYSLTVTVGGCTSPPSTTMVVVNPCPVTDLSIIKTVDNARPIYGHNVIFTITATNNGPATATGVTVLDIIQSGYLYVSSTLTTGVFDPTTGAWTVGTLNNGASAVLTVTVTVITGGNYVNTAIIYGNETDNNMANNVSTIVTSPTDFNIPEGFSPNGDGINDLFVIRGIDIYPTNSFVIFNRWGDKVYHASPYNNTWDGKSTAGSSVGGAQLPVGTYFYLLDLGDGSKIIKGTIYLNN